MHNIFGGPVHDTIAYDAVRDIQNTPSLVVDIEEQKNRYAEGFLDTLKNHSNYKVYRVAPTVVKASRVKIDVLKILYPPESPKPGPRWDWNTNESKNRRIPYFSQLS